MAPSIPKKWREFYISSTKRRELTTFLQQKWRHTFPKNGGSFHFFDKMAGVLHFCIKNCATRSQKDGGSFKFFQQICGRFAVLKAMAGVLHSIDKMAVVLLHIF
jgi:hypothetical protein